MTRRADDNPFVAVFMLVLLVGAAGGAIWISLREKANGERQYSSVESIPDSVLGQGGGTGSSNAPRFVDSFKQLPKRATSLQQAADAEFDHAAKSIGADELTQVQRIMSRGGSRDDYSDSELATMRRNGLTSWLRGKQLNGRRTTPLSTPRPKPFGLDLQK